MCMLAAFMSWLRKSVFVPLFSLTVEAPEKQAWLRSGREVPKVAETQRHPKTVGSRGRGPGKASALSVPGP